MSKKNWKEFRETGLLLFINQILHVFGWAIVFEMDEYGSISEVYPARVEFRGFHHDDVSDSYKQISKYVSENSWDLLVEAKKGHHD